MAGRAEKAKENHEYIPSPPEWPVSPLSTNYTPTGLYNGMIHPLVPFAIRGAIWYQGESNLGDGMLYFAKDEGADRRLAVGLERRRFPVPASCSWLPYRYGTANPTLLPKLWEAQTAALSIPDTGMAVTIDIGNPTDIHPKDKQDVGKRLALWALAKTYGKQIVYSGPLYKSMSIDGSKIRVKFEHVGGGLVARDNKPLDWFQSPARTKSSSTPRPRSTATRWSSRRPRCRNRWPSASPGTRWLTPTCKTSKACRRRRSTPKCAGEKH